MKRNLSKRNNEKNQILKGSKNKFNGVKNINNEI